VRTTFRGVLSTSFAVSEQADGEAGWQAIVSDPTIVAVFTDLDMPKLDGFGLLARIRQAQEPRIRDMPVVVISGNQEEAAKTRARNAGANDFISKSADAPEVLSRIDNLLRLFRTSKDLEVSQQALGETAMRDPLTGAFTPQYLATEAAKHFSAARRHGGQLSVMALRIDNYQQVSAQAGKDVADQLLGRIAKLVIGAMRAEDSVARSADTTFTVLAADTGAPQMLAFARRLHEQLSNARVSYGGQPLRIACSFGVSSLSVDKVTSIEELLQLAVQRLQSTPPPAEPAKPVELPAEIERAVQALEKASPALASEILWRLLPFLQASFRRLNVELPIDKLQKLLRGK
jgi:diguanylate cyclase (GGDEF)-like protein